MQTQQLVLAEGQHPHVVRGKHKVVQATLSDCTAFEVGDEPVSVVHVVERAPNGGASREPHAPIQLEPNEKIVSVTQRELNPYTDQYEKVVD